MFPFQTAVLTGLVMSVSALPYSEWSAVKNWKAVAARADTQARFAQIDTSACVVVTESHAGKYYPVRICRAEEEDNSAVCLSTRVQPCCADHVNGNKLSDTKVNVAGEDVTVTFYIANKNSACYILDDAHFLAVGCSHTLESCMPECIRITTTCYENTITSNSSSCSNGVCQCNPGYLPPDCCVCNTSTHYMPDCKPFCRDNCLTLLPASIGGCRTCSDGFIAAPHCCDCELGTTQVNGICKCNINLADDSIGCKEGSLLLDCCECDTEGNETHAFYKTKSGECKSYCREHCDSIGDSGCVTCRDGYQTEPECCGCDTIGNDTHAFYRTPDGECKPFCKSNCIFEEGSGCLTCNIGYATEPECCDCDISSNDTHGFYYDTISQECKPFCKNHCESIGDHGCNTCTHGYVTEPECCVCDTIGNDTHAFYKTTNDECEQFCKENCESLGDAGCATCKEGYRGEPKCCQCADSYIMNDDNEKCVTETNDLEEEILAAVEKVLKSFQG